MAVDFVARVVFPIENGEFREALDSEFWSDLNEK